ncbi:putative Cystatin domain-containing protein [Helianthus annuus]|uniref:Cysteine proteinase inhibitor n=1 Tax=Helianthus annuus TaxID=4232 RepID=A0A251TPH5_HELAN|nr:putative Cystatin domain-containing protein [Helianthus annuus]KAJ0523517.1 putative Cystatin domain-containing protein [Helianthus annuus]KAJ0885245.1 putative Cystatin domain-containing protein [Helianthus annuus]
MISLDSPSMNTTRSSYHLFLLYNTLLEFGKVLDANEQLVAGTLYFITLEATDGGVKKTYEAKVWVKE